MQSSFLQTSVRRKVRIDWPSGRMRAILGRVERLLNKVRRVRHHVFIKVIKTDRAVPLLFNVLKQVTERIVVQVKIAAASFYQLGPSVLSCCADEISGSVGKALQKKGFYAIPR